MIMIKKNVIKNPWLLLLISFICLANARQIRYSRYNTEVLEDGTNAADNQALDDENEVEATVREIKLAPYPASGFRPSRAFPLPNEATARNVQRKIEELVTEEFSIATTTETIDLTTTTQGYESETTTASNVDEDSLSENEKVGSGEWSGWKDAAPKAPYPPAGFQPRIPFLLPTDSLLKSEQHQKETEVKASYPSAGYFPSKAFILPSEQLQLEDEKKGDDNPKHDNSDHPVCGSSTNPLAPKPLEGEEEDPDSETINVNTKTQQGPLQQRAVVIPVRFSVQPLLLSRPLVFSPPIPSS